MGATHGLATDGWGDPSLRVCPGVLLVALAFGGGLLYAPPAVGFLLAGWGAVRGVHGAPRAESRESQVGRGARVRLNRTVRRSGPPQARFTRGEGSSLPAEGCSANCERR